MGYDIYVLKPDEWRRDGLRKANSKLMELSSIDHEANHKEINAVLKEIGEYEDLIYWRWNIGNMGTACRILMDLEVMYESSRGFRVPSLSSFGLTEEEFHSAQEAMYNDMSLDEETQSKVSRLDAARERYLTETACRQKGLPRHKFSDNSGWIITEEECGEAAEMLAEVSEPRLRSAIIEGMRTRNGSRKQFLDHFNIAEDEGSYQISTEEVDYWVQSIRGFQRVLEYASTHGGMEVC